MSAEGINFEMAPFLRMTVPRGLEALDLAEVEPGRLGRSWILLFGLLPVDYDDLGLERIEPGRGFLERSTMLSQRLWEHERTIEPRPGGGCTVTDRVAWEPRLPLPGPPAARRCSAPSSATATGGCVATSAPPQG